MARVRSYEDLVPLDESSFVEDKPHAPLALERPLFGDDAGLLRAALIVGVLITLWKVAIAATGNVIWEEAHFVVLGQHPALGYPDVPAGWPLFARLCTILFGWSPLAVRLCGLVVSQAIPFGVYFAARPLVSRREAIWAGFLSMLIPATTASGTVFYPEGALQLLTALMLGATIRALRTDKLGWWALTGLCGGLGLFIHYRFLLAGAGVVAFALIDRDGRRLWTRPGFWLAGVMAAAGLAPGFIYNMQEGWPSITYQVANRPSYSHGFDPTLLIAFLVQQAGLCTPVFFVGLLAGAWRARRRAHDGDSGASLGFWMGLAIFGTYLGLSPIDRQIMPHWPFMAYVAWLPFLPGVLIAFADAARTRAGRRLRAALIGLGPVIAVAGAIAGTVFEEAWAHPNAVPVRFRPLLFSKLEDWRQLEPVLARAEARAKKRFGTAPVLAASGHIPALRLEFPGVPGRRVYALGEPYDQFTRFSILRQSWGLDENGLRRSHAGGSVVLVLPEPTYLYHTRAEAQFRARLCREFDAVEPFETVELPPGRTAVEIYTARVRGTPAPESAAAPCPLLPELYLAHPVRAQLFRGAKRENEFGAAADPKGIRSVDVLLDGKVVAHARYGLDPPGGRISNVLAFDPNYPRVQFDFQFPKGSLTPGAHRVSLRATRSDGTVIEGAGRTIYAW